MKKQQDNILVSVIVPTYKRPTLLADCLDSLLASSYDPIEIIVIDNNPDALLNALKSKKKYASVQFIHKKENLGLSRSRTLGAHLAKGEWVLFVDDDNIVAKDMIAALVSCTQSDETIGAVGPLMYFYSDKRHILFAGAYFNFLTSKLVPLKKPSSYTTFYPCGDIHNVFMIRKDIGDRLSWFDATLHFTYEDFDLTYRIQKGGYCIGICPKAVDWHRVEKMTYQDELLHLVNGRQRAYFAIRNRAIIMKRYAPAFSLIFFSIFFYPFFFLMYLWPLIRFRKFSIIPVHLKGFLAGYTYILTGIIHTKQAEAYL